MRIQRIVLEDHAYSASFRGKIGDIGSSEKDPPVSRFFESAYEIESGAFTAS